jgi:transcriptional regulator with XRE-family HTH domain
MPRYTVGKHGPRPVDIHVGHRVRMRRTLLGMSQTALGEALGLTFQQLQKYERGANRISAGRLHELGQVLDVPPSYFFDEMPADSEESTTPRKVLKPVEKDPMLKRETLELVRAYYRIADPETRKRYRELVKSIA